MADLVFDSFNRNNGAVGVADSGQTWLFTGTYGLNITSNTVTSAGGSGYAYIDAGEVPDYVQASVQALTVSGNRTSIIFRGIDSNDYWLSLLYYASNTYTVYTAYYEAGTLKGSQNTVVSATTNNWYTLKIVDTGTTVETWFNGTKILTHTSTVHNTGQLVGVWMDSTSLRMDDFLAATNDTTVTLTVADAAHNHAAESPALTEGIRLVVADAAHGHSAESVTLTQAHLLAVANASHTHTAGAPILSTVPDLATVALSDAALYAAAVSDAPVYAVAVSDAAVTVLTLEESLG